MTGVNATVKFLLTRKATADALSMSVRKLDELTAAGKIPAVREGRLKLYRPRDLETYAEELEAWEPQR